MTSQNDLAAYIRANVDSTLAEDMSLLQNQKGSEAASSGVDLTAQLIPDSMQASATIITRQSGVLCGTAWFDQCFLSHDPDCRINWLAKDGDLMRKGQTLCEIEGQARAMLTAERSALNLLQTLSGTATRTRRHVDAVAGIDVKIMDTRKTIPGLRMAQKYAVRVGGGHNQRIGLHDGILIKENHIAAAGGIRPVLEQAFRLAQPGISVQIEVENLQQLEEALSAGAKLILLDNFEPDGLREAVRLTAKRAELEASGGITLTNLRDVALTGVDRISLGALTKDIEAMDFSMRISKSIL